MADVLRQETCVPVCVDTFIHSRDYCVHTNVDKPKIWKTYPTSENPDCSAVFLNVTECNGFQNEIWILIVTVIWNVHGRNQLSWRLNRRGLSSQIYTSTIFKNTWMIRLGLHFSHKPFLTDPRDVGEILNSPPATPFTRFIDLLVMSVCWSLNCLIKMRWDAGYYKRPVSWSWTCGRSTTGWGMLGMYWINWDPCESRLKTGNFYRTTRYL